MPHAMKTGYTGPVLIGASAAAKGCQQTGCTQHHACAHTACQVLHKSQAAFVSGDRPKLELPGPFYAPAAVLSLQEGGHAWTHSATHSTHLTRLPLHSIARPRYSPCGCCVHLCHFEQTGRDRGLEVGNHPSTARAVAFVLYWNVAPCAQVDGTLGRRHGPEGNKVVADAHSNVTRAVHFGPACVLAPARQHTAGKGRATVQWQHAASQRCSHSKQQSTAEVASSPQWLQSSFKQVAASSVRDCCRPTPSHSHAWLVGAGQVDGCCCGYGLLAC